MSDVPPRALIFPGQGSQAPGMGKTLADASAAAREVFEEVDEALGERLSRLMFEGPEDRLTLTANAQPAIMAHSIAVLRVLEREAGLVPGESFRCAAGHSLGEYSALCAAGSLSLADTARLLRRRGEAMQDAVPVGEGAMAALLGLDFAEAKEVAAAAAESDVCVAANDNAPGQVVISGHKAAVERAIPLAKEKGAKRGLMLPVSAPFHSPLMQPAAEAMQAALQEARLDVPTLPVVANVTAAPVTDPADIKRLLVVQVTGTVRWRESMAWMASSGGCERFVELGAKIVGPMVKRITAEAEAQSVVTMDDIEALAKEF